jgi:O-antigen ligase
VLFAVELSAPARRHLFRLALPLVLAAVAYVALFAGSSSPLGRPIDRALTLFDSDNPSNLYRLLELENLRYTVERHPWGIGFGHPYEMIRSLPRVEFPLQYFIPHNEVMWLWVKTGSVGFILVMFFFGRIIAEGVWTYRHVGDPLLRTVAAVVPLAIANQLLASSFELQLTYARNMIYLGTLIGLLGPIQAWTHLSVRGRRLPERSPCSGSAA